MEFQTVVNQRKMIRSFKDSPIPEEKLNQILKNMFKGPSAGFSQGTEVLILDNPESREKFYSQYGSKEERKREDSKWPTLEDAPIIILVCANKEIYINRYAEPDKGWTDKDEKR